MLGGSSESRGERVHRESPDSQLRQPKSSVNHWRQRQRGRTVSLSLSLPSSLPLTQSSRDQLSPRDYLERRSQAGRDPCPGARSRVAVSRCCLCSLRVSQLTRRFWEKERQVEQNEATVFECNNVCRFHLHLTTSFSPPVDLEKTANRTEEHTLRRQYN